jgi:uncharacterized protein involved in outer membrane biogenesis
MSKGNSQQADHVQTSRPRWWRWLFNRWVVATVVVLVLYAAAGFLLAPYLVRHFVPELAAEQLHRDARIGEVRINPFLLTFEAKDLSFGESDGTPIAGFDRLFVDFEAKSLFRWAWTFADIRLEGPGLNLVIGQDGRLNLARIADELPKGEPRSQPTESSAPTRLIIEQASLADGRVTFTDRSNPTPASTTVEPLNLRFTDITTLPERRGPYGVTASLPGGGSLSWQGEISLEPLASNGSIHVDGFRVSTAWQFFQDRLRLAEPAGALDAQIGYRFAYADGQTTLSAEPIALTLQGLSLSETGATSPILALSAVEIPGARFDLGSRELVVPEISIRGGSAAAVVASDGSVNWAKLVVADDGASAPGPEGRARVRNPSDVPWTVRIEALGLNGIALHYADDSRAAPLVADVGDIGIGLSFAAELGGETALSVEGLGVALHQVAVAEKASAEPLLTLDDISLTDGRIDLADREISLPRIQVTGGAARLTRAADGGIRELQALSPGDQGVVHREIEEPGEAAAAEGRPWRFGLDQLTLSGFALGFSDELTTPALSYDLDKVQVLLTDIRNDGETPLTYEASLDVRQGGHVSVSGSVASAGSAADADLKLEAIALDPLAALVAKFTTLTLKSGQLSGGAHVAYSSEEAHPRLKADGALEVERLLLNEADTGDRLLEWKGLAVNGIDFSLGPDRLAIKEVRVQEPGAKIIVFEDQTVNLAKVVRPGEAGPPAAEPPEEPSPAFPVTVERVRVDKGTVDFADLSLVLPFKTRVHRFAGSISGISTDPKRRATLKLAGQVDRYGEAKVDGSLLTADPTRFTDIKVAFRNVSMTSLSPYSATFAGRSIGSGKLDLDLQYKIDKSALLGTNQVLLRDFTLGDPVQSDRAAHLPLDLAIALLTDGDGKIDVAVPVSGDLESPEFSFGHLIGKAIANLIGKVVTAPFRALGAVLGGDAEKLASLEFAPGSAELAPPEREKLDTMAKGLTERPQLKLTVFVGFDPAVDGEAIKDLNLRLALARKLEVDLAPGEDPGPVPFDDAKTQRALEKLAKELGGDKALDQFQAAFEQRTGREAKRVNPALALIGRASDDLEFYQALFAYMVEQTPRPDAELQALAERRAAAIVEELTVVGGLDPSRVTTADVEPVTAAEGEVPARLELGI